MINTTAQERLLAVKAAGLMKLPLTGGCGPNGAVIRNGTVVKSLGALVARDAQVEERGCYRAPHGAEADALFSAGGCDDVATLIALHRASSNGRNIFWEGGPGGAASTPQELEDVGPKEARRLAFERVTMWRAMPKCAWPHEFWAMTITPDEYYSPERLKHLCYRCWGYNDWNQNARRTGLIDFTVGLAKKYGWPEIGTGSSLFFEQEGKGMGREPVWFKDLQTEKVIGGECPEGYVLNGWIPRPAE